MLLLGLCWWQWSSNCGLCWWQGLQQGTAGAVLAVARHLLVAGVEQLQPLLVAGAARKTGNCGCSPRCCSAYAGGRVKQLWPLLVAGASMDRSCLQRRNAIVGNRRCLVKGGQSCLGMFMGVRHGHSARHLLPGGEIRTSAMLPHSHPAWLLFAESRACALAVCSWAAVVCTAVAPSVFLGLSGRALCCIWGTCC